MNLFKKKYSAPDDSELIVASEESEAATTLVESDREEEKKKEGARGTKFNNKVAFQVDEKSIEIEVIAAKRYERIVSSIRVIQRNVKMYQAASNMKRMGALAIQRNVRMYQAAREYQLKLKSVRILQRCCRSYQGRRHIARVCHNSELMIEFEDKINMMLSFSY